MTPSLPYRQNQLREQQSSTLLPTTNRSMVQPRPKPLLLTICRTPCVDDRLVTSLLRPDRHAIVCSALQPVAVDGVACGRIRFDEPIAPLSHRVFCLSCPGSYQVTQTRNRGSGFRLAGSRRTDAVWIARLVARSCPRGSRVPVDIN